MNRLRFLTSPLRILPDYVIAGEAKCGTTSLYRYLLQHPSVLPADEKEPNNFRHFGASPLFCRAHFPLVTTRAWRRMRTGAVDVNGGRFNIAAPFGGYKQSGYGRENGVYGIDEFLQTKSLQL